MLSMPEWFQGLAVCHVGRRNQGYDRNSITGQGGWCGIFCCESELSVFLFFLHLRCSNVCTYAAVRLRDGPAQTTTTLTVCLPLRNYKRHTPSRGDSSGKDGKVSSFHSGFG